VNYGAGSGVIVDACKAHGLYLDAGELRRILAWVGAGGRLAAAENAAAKTPPPYLADLRGLREDDLDTSESLEFTRLGRFLSRVFK
jgi:Zn-finger nucleic acid-binding protein